MYWNRMAKLAFLKGGTFFVLLGDDIEMPTAELCWAKTIINEFESMFQDKSLNLPCCGFGCVALSDAQAPGFPTFPIVHRSHIEALNELFSDEFVNQDADPFLFQLYVSI